jgi:hypothetical protein
MTNMLKMGLLTLGIGLAFHAADSSATIGVQELIVSSIDFCQAFTPGISNTIRNRVIGSENVGTAAIAVACDLPTSLDDNGNNTADNQIKFAFLVFANGNATDVTFNCTLLTGSPGLSAGDAYTATHPVTITANSVGFTQFDGSDNPTPAATLNSILVGYNCMLPPHVTMTAIDMGWDADNGVGS